MACIELSEIKDLLGIKLHKNAKKDIDTEKGKKPYRFDTHKITPRIIFDLFSQSSTKGKSNPIIQIREAIKSAGTNNNNVMKRLIGVMNVIGKNNLLYSDLIKKNMDDQEKHDMGREIQIRGIVMRAVFTTIKSEADVQKKIGVEGNDAKGLFTGSSRRVPTLGMATAIGRDIAHATGFKLKADPILENRIYNQIGLNAIMKIAEEGGPKGSKALLGIDTNGAIINNKYKKNQIGDSVGKNSQVLIGHTVVWLNYDAFSEELDKTNSKASRKKLSIALDEGAAIDIMGEQDEQLSSVGDVFGAAKFINRMSVPTNIKIPTSNRNMVTSNDDIRMSSRMHDILKEMQDKRTIVNPKLGKFFKYLNSLMVEQEGQQDENEVISDFKTVIKKAFMDDTDLITAVFGTLDESQPDDIKAKAVGQSLSRTSTLQVMVEMADQFFDADGNPTDIYFSHEMYRTGRVGQLETVLNAQTDKFFSRFVLTGGEYSVKIGSREFNHLLNSIQDDAGKSFTPDVILGNTKNTELDNLLKEYEKAFVSNTKDSDSDQFQAQRVFFESINDGYLLDYEDETKMTSTRTNLAVMKGSVWQQLSTVEAIYNVRHPKGKIIRTYFQTKPDATGSGIILQFLQMIGMVKGEGANTKLQELGILDKDQYDGEFLDDVYGFLDRELKNVDARSGKEALKSQLIINNIINFGFVSSMRDIVKPTTMITSYMAGEASIKSESAQQYTDEIFDKLKREKSGDSVNFILDMIKKQDKDVYDEIVRSAYGDISGYNIVENEYARNTVKDYLTENVGNHMYNMIGKALTDKVTSVLQSKMTGLYTAMENIFAENVRKIISGEIDEKDGIELRVLPAQIVMDMKEDPDHSDWKNADGSMKTHAELLKSYGMIIMSASQIIADLKGEKVLITKESVNSITSLVNVIHAMDSSILHIAHRRTMDKISEILETGKEDGKKITIFRRTQLAEIQNQSSKGIHDANNSNAVYNTIYQDEYRQAISDVLYEYDMYGQMVKSYGTIHGLNTADMDNDAYAKMIVEAEAGLAEKQKIIDEKRLDLNSKRIFGFDDKVETSEVIEVDEKIDEDVTVDNRTPAQKVIDVLSVTKNEILKRFSTLPNVSEIIKSGKEWKYTPSENTITVDEKKYDDLTYEESLAHEVVHFSTLAYLMDSNKAKTNDVRYVRRVVEKLSDSNTMKNISDILNEKGYENALDRFNYAMTRSDDNDKVAEFVAIMAAEPATAQIIYLVIEKEQSILVSKKIRKTINMIINNIYSYIVGASRKDIKLFDETGKVDVLVLAQSINAINVKGETFTRDKPAEAKKARDKYDGSLQAGKKKDPRSEINRKLKYKAYTPVSPDKYTTPLVDDAIVFINMKASTLYGNMIHNTDNTNRVGKGIITADEYMSNNLPLYKQNRDRFVEYWDYDGFIKALRGFFNPERMGDRITMQQLLTLQYKATAERGTTDSMLISNMDALMGDLTEEQIADIYHTTTQSPIFHLINDDNEWIDLIEGKVSIEDIIKKYSSKLENNEIKSAKKMANMLTGKDEELINIGDSYNSNLTLEGDTRRVWFQRLVAAESINNTNYKDAFKILKDNPKLSTLISEASFNMKVLHESVFKESDDARRYRENIIDDIFDANYDIRAFTVSDHNFNKYPESEGWQILRTPKEKEYGVIYRKSNDETYQDGAGTTVGHRNSDVLVPQDKRIPNAKNVLTTDVGKGMNRHKIILTVSEKNILGMKKSPSHALYRSYSRILEISETQAARDLILSNEITMKINTIKDLASFDEEIVDMKVEDIKWMLSLPDGVNPSDISNKSKNETTGKMEYKYPNLAKHFMNVDRASNVGGFKTNLDMVRKDVNPWLFGYKDPVLFEKSPRLRKMAYSVRQLVKLAKINWIITNPIKIMNDAISNVAILAGYDVPARKMVMYGKDVMKGVTDLEKLRIEYLKAKMHGKKAEAMRLDKKIKEHDMSIMLNNGMLQSINVEILSRDSSVVTGVQDDIENLLNMILKKEDGERSSIANGIDALAGSGFSLESILEFTGKGVQSVGFLQKFGEDIENAGLGMRNEREKGDMAKYVSEYLMTPGSQAVNFGSYLVQMSDIIPRGILLRHLMDDGMNEAEAILQVTDAFIDYKQNMPKELKVMSDYGILLFPSFWMRIQRVIYRLATKKPVTVMAALAAEEIFMLDIPTIFDANLYAKMTGYGTIVDAPPILGFFE